MRVKKQFAVILSGLLLALAVCGCSNGEDGQKGVTEITQEETINSEDSVVKLTVWAESDNFEMMEQMIGAFKEKYAGEAQFEIELVHQPDASTKDTLLSDVHNGADVFSMPDDQLLGMIAAGALAPVPDSDEIKNANLSEAVEAATHNGILYAYPYTADNGYFLYYDKQYFTEEDVKTLDGIMAVAEREGKKFAMEFNSGWYMYAFFGGTGMEFGINEDGVTNYCNWNTTQGEIKGTDVVESMLTYTASPGFKSQGDAEFVDSIKSGEVIAGISGVWNAIGVREAWGNDYGACKLPTYTCAGKQIQMSSFTGYKMMGVNAYSDNVEWAHKLAAWLTNEENQTIRFEIRNQGPSNINAAASDAVNKVPAILAVIEQSQYGNLQRVGNLYWDACTDFADEILAGNPDGRDLQKMVDGLVAGITASTIQ